jgi:hypothetical protein
MKVFWWQGGLHLEPENKNEAQALVTVIESLNFIDIDQSSATSPLEGLLAGIKDMVEGRVRSLAEVEAELAKKK